MLHSKNSLPLLQDPSLATVTSSLNSIIALDQGFVKSDDSYLILATTSLHLVSEDFSSGLLSLCLVNVLHKYTLVLENITLRLHVERVVTEKVEIHYMLSIRHRKSGIRTGACQSCQPPGTSVTISSKLAVCASRVLW